MEIPSLSSENTAVVLRWLQDLRKDTKATPVNEVTLGILFSLVDHPMNETDSTVSFAASKTIGVLLSGWGESDDEDEVATANLMVEGFSDILDRTSPEQTTLLLGSFLALRLIGGNGNKAFIKHYSRADYETQRSIDVIWAKYDSTKS